jgi:hypothetical protein
MTVGKLFLRFVYEAHHYPSTPAFARGKLGSRRRWWGTEIKQKGRIHSRLRSKVLPDNQPNSLSYWLQFLLEPFTATDYIFYHTEAIHIKDI